MASGRRNSDTELRDAVTTHQRQTSQEEPPKGCSDKKRKRREQYDKITENPITGMI